MIMTFMPCMVTVVMTCWILMFATGSTAVMTFLSFSNQVVLLIAFALVRRAVALPARVVITDTTWVFSRVVR